MNGLLRRIAAGAALSVTALAAMATGWPAAYQGVMLQGFYWDSYKDTKWTDLESQADELSQYFTLIWVPQSAKPASSPSMGYDPVYWFSHYSSSFGNEADLRSMIKTYKDKGVGVIADVVVNHRSGVSNWTNFPKETWNGKTYQLGPEHICSTDEVRNQAGQAKPTGAPDTGEDFGGSRDLDHTNATVQDNIKDYCRFLLTDLGYTGFRYDMAKGFGAQYIKIYNQASKPSFSVGEYWDGSYDAVKAWIDGCGKESAAFDFPFKYAVNQAFASNDMTKLVWKANGTEDQPAGMIHYGYAQYAVTFIDNHDTYRDDNNKFTGNVLAANAFMLCSPGTPCVFLPHWKASKAAIKALISVRNAVGVTNTSTVKVLRSQRDCYMAEVTGTNGTLVVKIGSAQVSPDGYTQADIKASGTDYCVWTKSDVQGGSHGGDTPDTKPFKIYYDNTATQWTAPHIHYWGGTESTWPGVAMTLTAGDVWEYTVPGGTTGCLFNAGDGDATKTADFEAEPGHIYSRDGDCGLYDKQGGDGDYPAGIYLVGTVNSTSWATAHGIRPDEADGGSYTWNSINVDDAGAGIGYFSFLTRLDDADGDWDNANQGDRYGAVSKDALAEAGRAVPVRRYEYLVDAMAAEAWSANPAIYSIRLDLKAMTLTLGAPAGSVDGILCEDLATPEYYTIQGVRVNVPDAQGIYIERRGAAVRKVIIR